MAFTLVVRADGGPTIGYGHLVRTRALVEPVLENGGSAVVVTATLETARTVYPRAVDIIEIDSRSDPDQFVSALDSVPADAVVADAYPVDTAYQRAVRDRKPLAVVDDTADEPLCADLLVNGNLYARTLEYEYVGSPPKCLLGPEFVPLRREIREFAARDPPWRPDPERALITMGGGDTAELTPIVLDAFEGTDVAVDVIVGPGFNAAQESAIRQTASDLGTHVSVYRDPDDLPERMFEADLAVCTASSTTYELLSLGTPLVCVAVADNQEPIVNALRSREVAIALDRQPTRAAFRDAIQALLSDSAARREYRDKGRELIDGRGVYRIRSELLSLVDENEGS